MGTLPPGKSCAHRERLLEELVKGRDMMTQLQILLKNPSGDNESDSAHELASKIYRSFTETLSVVKGSWESGEVGQIPGTTGQVGSPGCGDRRSVDSGQSSKRPAGKDRRGSYKRRKPSSSMVEVTDTMDDGYAWRKYGQKDIQNAKFPRCYFRCTHKPDQGCLATKQVQRIQEEPHILFQATYFGHHTCRDDTVLHKSPTTPPIILDSDPPPTLESHNTLFSFKSNDQEDQCHTVLSIKEETQSNNLTSEKNKGTADHQLEQSIVWPELMPLDASVADHHDLDQDVISNVYSSASTVSHHGLGMDFLTMESFENDVQHFYD